MGEPLSPYWLRALGEDLPGSVARPGDLNELSAALRDAWEAGASVRPWGGGTQMTLGLAMMPAPDRVLDLTLLDAVMDHRPEDMTVTVQAGVRWGALRELLAGSGHELPFDPPVPLEATVGGMTAVGLSGPRRLAHGRLRDWLLGVQVMRPDGTVTRAGGRVVKNVSGYELTKLYAGSLGTLGVITEVTFKTRPLAPARRVAAVPLPGPEAMEAVAARILGSPLEPAFLEAFWITANALEGREGGAAPPPELSGLDGGRLLASLLGRAAGVDPSGFPWLLVGFEGVHERTAWQLRTLQELLKEGRRALGPADTGGEWASPEARGSMFQVLPLPWDACHPALVNGYRVPPAWERDEASLFASLLSSQVAAYLAAVQRTVAPLGVQAALFAHTGNGGVAIHLAGPAGGLETAGRALREEAGRLRGTLVLRHGPLALRQALPLWGDLPAAYGLMRALKAKLDPRRVLNPGRFVGAL